MICYSGESQNIVRKKQPKKQYGVRGKRFVIGYRGLNVITKKIVTHFFRIGNVINRLRDSKYFTTLDVASGFHQIEMNPKSIEKTAFISRLQKACTNLSSSIRAVKCPSNIQQPHRHGANCPSIRNLHGICRRDIHIFVIHH